MELNERLREARTEKGFTQSYIAKKLGLETYQFWSDVERNKCALPPRHFKKVAKVLGIRLEEMVELYVNDKANSLYDELGI